MFSLVNKYPCELTQENDFFPLCFSIDNEKKVLFPINISFKNIIRDSNL